jgi:hypothetical protein
VFCDQFGKQHPRWPVSGTGQSRRGRRYPVHAAFATSFGVPATVVVEFTKTSFIDSTVVAALVRRSLGGETLLLVVPREASCFVAPLRFGDGLGDRVHQITAF